MDSTVSQDSHKVKKKLKRMTQLINTINTVHPCLSEHLGADIFLLFR